MNLLVTKSFTICGGCAFLWSHTASTRKRVRDFSLHDRVCTVLNAARQLTLTWIYKSSESEPSLLENSVLVNRYTHQIFQLRLCPLPQRWFFVCCWEGFPSFFVPFECFWGSMTATSYPWRRANVSSVKVFSSLLTAACCKSQIFHCTTVRMATFYIPFCLRAVDTFLNIRLALLWWPHHADMVIKRCCRSICVTVLRLRNTC